MCSASNDAKEGWWCGSGGGGGGVGGGGGGGGDGGGGGCSGGGSVPQPLPQNAPHSICFIRPIMTKDLDYPSDLFDQLRLTQLDEE
ncbi:hypothetical protein V1478_015019 [Vespula squamosa]|uniref:Uncharacterized protein n=1 Tax=Vespula squamosa TaxID=30214 RepID=A0ABD2A3W6_VESSQ